MNRETAGVAFRIGPIPNLAIDQRAAAHRLRRRADAADRLRGLFPDVNPVNALGHRQIIRRRLQQSPTAELGQKPHAVREPRKTHFSPFVEAHRVRVLPAAADTVVVFAEHAPAEVLLFGVQPRASGEKARRFASVLGGCVNPALGLYQRRHQRARGVGMTLNPFAAGAENFFRMLRPDILRSGGGEADTIVYRARVPRFANAKAAHIADAHVHYHLRRRHNDGANIVKGINSTARQPVVEPHRVGAGWEGVGEGVAARRLLADQFFQPAQVGDALLLQLAGERYRLTVAVKGHQIGHRLRFTGDPQLKAVEHAVQNVRGVQLPGNQLVAHRRPAGLLARDEGDTVLFIESLQGSDS